jgi:hypothetical protein
MKQIALYAKNKGLTVEMAIAQAYRNRNAKIHSDSPKVKQINNVVGIK